MCDKSKTCYYKPRPICLRLLTTVKPNIFERKGPSLGKHTIFVWVFRCYESSLMSSSHFTWNDHINRFSIKANYTSLLHSSVLCNQANVSKHMFHQTSGIVYTFLTSFMCFTPSLFVKGLPMWDFSCQNRFCSWPPGKCTLTVYHLTA